ncbi:MAG TPA: hypothetical protein PKA64_20810, partial [Myxococcota bacterium]|nr:hypothetical protein [Myxococcota bacterium]
MNRTLPALLLSLLAGVGVAGPRVSIKPGTHPKAVLAEAKLQAGQPLLAADAAYQCVRDEPDALSCWSVMARARARLGQCGLVRDVFARLRSSAEWDGTLAMAEGLCDLRRGDLSLAFTVLDESIELRDRDPVPRFERAISAMRARRFDQARDDIDALREADATTGQGGPGQEPWMADLLDAWWELETGDPDIDGTLALSLAFPGEIGANTRTQWSLLDCRRWLDVGDPFRAEEVARSSLSGAVGQTRLVACRVEALRRMRDDSESWIVVTRPWHKMADSLAMDAVRVRMLVDRGDLDEAAKLLTGLPEGADPDVVASAWYLARARGDAAAAARYEAAYAAWD